MNDSDDGSAACRNRPAALPSVHLKYGVSAPSNGKLELVDDNKTKDMLAVFLHFSKMQECHYLGAWSLCR